MTTGDSGCEAYTAIAWGVGLSHGHHVYRAYFKHAFLKQYEKFSTFLRNELCSNNERDGSRYAYRLTTKGLEVSLLFLFFYSYSFTNVCAGPSPTAASIINPWPDIDPIAGSRRPTTVPM